MSKSDQTDHVQCPIVALSPDDRKHAREVRQRLEDGDPSLAAAYQRLRADADAALTVEPGSVVDDPLVAPSGDPHDYTSLGPYWWPDPQSPDGLPYIRRDGQRNPESHSGDFAAMHRMVEAAIHLILTGYFTGQRRYAERAALLLRVFFLDPATRMNPHLEYSQRIPGVCDGRCIGIIDTHRFVPLVELLPLLGESGVWPAEDDAALRRWFAAMLDWLTGSALGREEADRHNNHGTWYDAQVAAFAMYAERPDVARQVLRDAPQCRIVSQIEPDRRQPHELERTLSFTYSVFNLQALASLAQIGTRLGVDLWGFEDSQGRSIPAALRFLAPYLTRPGDWPHPQIKPIVTRKLYWLLAIAADATGDAGLLQALDGHAPDDDPAQLVYTTT